MIPPRAHMALAVDGGGIKGLLVARALMALERELGVERLIEHPALNILAGTSTGSLVTGGIAVGMTAAEIADLYIQAGQRVFPPLFPAWVPAGIRSLLRIAIGLTRPSLYPNEPLKELIRNIIGEKTGNPDLTMADLRKRLRPDQALVVTVADINERRTHFVKSYKDNDAGWPVWEALLTSASEPTALPVVQRQDRYYSDGGLGSFGNPAYVAAREAVDWQGYPPGEVSVFSFGVGWLNDVNFQRANGIPARWNVVDWAKNAPLIMLGDGIRAQSLDIIADFITGQGQGMDFRRFQLELQDDIAPDDSSPAAIARLIQLGDELGKRVLNDQHALGTDPNFDPEGLRSAQERYEKSIRDARL
jgi:predicted acylesterase/phospholipase RssA